MSDEPHLQIGAIPWRRISGDRIEILLITVRGEDAWRIPLGDPETGRDEPSAAARSAGEEAGVSGSATGPMLGSYVYRREEGHTRVRVYPIEVAEIADKWKAGSRLERRWFRRDDAIGEIELSGLREVVRRFFDQAS